VATEVPVGTREHLLAAAEQVIKDHGVRAATTRAIAEAAGCAEGSIYRHFAHKHALLVEVIKRRYPEYMTLLGSLPERVGKGSVRKTLEELVSAGLQFYRGLVPMVAGTVAERKLLEEHRRRFEEGQGGPLPVLNRMTDYIRQEQRLGRISSRVSAGHVSRVLLGAPFGQAFLEEMLGPRVVLGTDEQFAKEVVRLVMEGISPPKLQMLGGTEQVSGPVKAKMEGTR
jgi:AcrR family transcriptional regulator